MIQQNTNTGILISVTAPPLSNTRALLLAKPAEAPCLHCNTCARCCCRAWPQPGGRRRGLLVRRRGPSPRAARPWPPPEGRRYNEHRSRRHGQFATGLLQQPGIGATANLKSPTTTKTQKKKFQSQVSETVSEGNDNAIHVGSWSKGKRTLWRPPNRGFAVTAGASTQANTSLSLSFACSQTERETR